eukprot:gene38587-3849_t
MMGATGRRHETELCPALRACRDGERAGGREASHRSRQRRDAEERRARKQKGDVFTSSPPRERTERAQRALQGRLDTVRGLQERRRDRAERRDRRCAALHEERQLRADMAQWARRCLSALLAPHAARRREAAIFRRRLFQSEGARELRDLDRRTGASGGAAPRSKVVDLYDTIIGHRNVRNERAPFGGRQLPPVLRGTFRRPKSAAPGAATGASLFGWIA